MGAPLTCPDQHAASGLRDPKPVRGREAYAGKIAELVAATPDLQLELIDSATVPGSATGEQLVFLHYVGRGTGPAGPITIRGLDRVRTRDGMVVENVIRYGPVEQTAPRAATVQPGDRNARSAAE